MSLRKMRRNARAAINYNLAGKLPTVAGETWAGALARGASINEARAAEEARLEALNKGVNQDEVSDGDEA